MARDGEAQLDPEAIALCVRKSIWFASGESRFNVFAMKRMGGEGIVSFSLKTLSRKIILLGKVKPSPRKIYTELLLSPNGLGWIQRGALHSFKAHQRKEVTCYYGTWWGRQGRTKTRCHGVNGAQEPGLARQAGFRRPRLDSRPNGRNTGCSRPLDTHLHTKSRVQNTTPGCIEWRAGVNSICPRWRRNK